jgi:hypothetical protein
MVIGEPWRDQDTGETQISGPGWFTAAKPSGTSRCGILKVSLKLNDREYGDGGTLQSFLVALINTLGELRCVRSGANGQYKDDPRRVLEALQTTLYEFESNGDRFLTSSEADKICDILLGEIRQYRQEHFNYLCDKDYEEALRDIEHLLDIQTFKWVLDTIC